MTRPAPIGLHIGLPKTGTTSLQELVFARHPQLRYFGQTNIWSDPGAKTLLRALLVEGAPEAEQVPEILAAARSQRDAVVISDEALSLGEFMLRATRWPINSDPFETARRAKRLLGDAEVLLVLRNQADWLVSWHRQGLKTGKYVETDLQRWLDVDLGDAAAARLFELLRYDRLYQAYAEAFGPDRVTVRLYEHHQGDLAAVARDFLGQIGVDPGNVERLLADGARNVTGQGFSGLPPWVQRTVRARPVRAVVSGLPTSLRRSLRGVAEVKRAYKPATPVELGAIRSRFGQGNQAIFDELGIDPEGLGYW